MDDGSAPQGQKTVIPNDFGPDTRDEFQVLKHDGRFAVFTDTGDMNGAGSAPAETSSKDGLFLYDTRVLSRFRLALNGTPVVALGATVSDDTAIFTAGLANGAMTDSRGRRLKPFALHIRRERFLHETLFDRLTITNYSGADVDIDLCVDMWADFRDVFEIRGVDRDARGRLAGPKFDARSLTFGYTARDGVPYRTLVVFDREMSTVSGRSHLPLRLTPGESSELSIAVHADKGLAAEGAPPAALIDVAGEARRRATRMLGGRRGRLDLIRTSRPTFDGWLRRSAADLSMLTADLETGAYPHAGVPWFSAPFGRDALITSMQTLWLDPALARGVLTFLAATQAKHQDPVSEAAPGKILHEARDGEMARLGEIPFGKYYGGVDQTLLFVMLVAAHYRRTGDRDFLATMEPHVARALDWADTSGDMDGDGFIEYHRSDSRGLRNQGWKDSENAVFLADGTLAEGPIALVEVQAYFVAALRSAGEIYTVLGDADRAAVLTGRSKKLVEQIDAAFWDDELGTWAMALDGAKRRTACLSTNAGHVLFAAAAKPERLERFRRTMAGDDILTDWGLRTVGRGAALFNPMGYHTGSIWPHDNSLIAAGFARYGEKALACRITNALFEASRQFPDQRLPELFCGFSSSEMPQLALYPSACSPQAWAAGAPFLCLQATLGLDIDVPNLCVSIDGPELPSNLSHLEIRGLDVGGHRVDLRFVRSGSGKTNLEVLKATPDLTFSFHIQPPTPDPAGGTD